MNIHQAIDTALPLLKRIEKYPASVTPAIGIEAFRMIERAMTAEKLPEHTLVIPWCERWQRRRA